MSQSQWPYYYYRTYWPPGNEKAKRSGDNYPSYRYSFLLHFENNSEMGAFALLTNSYCLAAVGDSINFNSRLNDSFEQIPIVFTSIANCRIVGRLCAGNKHGLLVPNNITDLELDRIKNSLPDSVKITCVEEKMCALGNLIACNDKTAIIHPELDQETVEIIADTLNVEVFRRTIAGNSLVGSYCALNNYGGLVPDNTSATELEELADLLQIPIIAGTVNGGKKTIGAGLTINDWRGLIGLASDGTEISKIQRIFKLDGTYGYL